MLTNDTNISLSMAVWLASDNYDHTSDPNTISATTLLKPIREIVLARQNMNLAKKGDVSSLIPSSTGTAIHDSIEASWINETRRKEALTKLGYPESVINNIVVNPTKEELTPDSIPVYLEQRVFKQVGKYIISGKYDFVGNGHLEDFKSCSVYSYILQSNADKYIQQGSIYRWLNPEIITDDIMTIQYFFTDWNRLDSIKDTRYPNHKIMHQNFELMPVTETERFVTNILNTLDRYKDTDQDSLPRCTPEELWIKPTVWKYYKDPSKTTRATKNFDNSADANHRLMADGNKGIVKEVQGEPTKCKYCSVSAICSQAQEYVNMGQLTLD